MSFGLGLDGSGAGRMQLTDRNGGAAGGWGWRGSQRCIRGAQFVTLFTMCATSLVGCPAFLSDDYTIIPIDGGVASADGNSAGAKDAAAAATGPGDASPTGPDADAAVDVESVESPDANEAGTSPADVGSPPGDAGTVCTPIPALFQCGAGTLSINGSTFDNRDPMTGQCVATATPAACRCLETYTCFCVELNSHSCFDAFSKVYANVTCAMQSNGVPLVSCQ